MTQSRAFRVDVGPSKLPSTSSVLGLCNHNKSDVQVLLYLILHSMTLAFGTFATQQKQWPSPLVSDIHFIDTCSHFIMLPLFRYLIVFDTFHMHYGNL